MIPATIAVWDDKMSRVAEILMVRENCVPIFIFGGAQRLVHFLRTPDVMQHNRGDMQGRWRGMGNFKLRLRQVRACEVFQNFDHEWGVKVEVQSFLGNELKKVCKFGWI